MLKLNLKVSILVLELLTLALELSIVASELLKLTIEQSYLWQLIWFNVKKRCSQSVTEADKNSHHKYHDEH